MTTMLCCSGVNCCDVSHALRLTACLMASPLAGDCLQSWYTIVTMLRNFGSHAESVLFSTACRGASPRPLMNSKHPRNWMLWLGTPSLNARQSWQLPVRYGHSSAGLLQKCCKQTWTCFQLAAIPTWDLTSSQWKRAAAKCLFCWKMPWHNWFCTMVP